MAGFFVCPLGAGYISWAMQCYRNHAHFLFFSTHIIFPYICGCASLWRSIPLLVDLPWLSVLDLVIVNWVGSIDLVWSFRRSIESLKHSTQQHSMQHNYAKLGSEGPRTQSKSWTWHPVFGKSWHTHYCKSKGMQHHAAASCRSIMQNQALSQSSVWPACDMRMNLRVVTVHVVSTCFDQVGSHLSTYSISGWFFAKCRLPWLIIENQQLQSPVTC